MKLDLFPPEFKSHLDARTQQSIYEEQNRSSSQQDTISSSTGSKPNAFAFVFGVGLAGFCIGFFICCSNCESFNAPDVADSLVWWFLFTFGGLILGVILYIAAISSYTNNVNRANRQMSNETRQLEKNINQIRSNAEKKYAEYSANFEGTAQQMSVQFAESQLAIEVIDWMTSGYIRTIDAADRRSHIKNLNIPFNFNVYTNKITCNLGTFDFEIQRCRNLNSPLEQTALARAIASAIQLNITMKYPKDVSGTDIITNISYTYGADYVSTTIIYTAQNGNYRTVRDWS